MAPAQGSSPGQQDRTGASSSSTSVGKAVPLAMQLEEQQQAMDQAAGVPPVYPEPLVVAGRHALKHTNRVLHACTWKLMVHIAHTQNFATRTRDGAERMGSVPICSTVMCKLRLSECEVGGEVKA